MVISFSIYEAREQLLNHGIVYTYRWTRRAFFRKGLGVMEHTWANAKRGRKRIADVWIEEIGKLQYSELEPYVSESGFKNLEKWSREILEMANPYGELDGYLYKVRLSEGTLSDTRAQEGVDILEKNVNGG